MTPTPPGPSDPGLLLERLGRTDTGRPRLTSYDDTPGPTAGERLDLSARVLSNWAAKVANLLVEEIDARPGTVVRLDLPVSWRLAYWAFGVWATGAAVSLDDGRADLVVSTRPEALEGLSVPGILVTMPALARQAPAPVPEGALDEARDLAAQGDVFVRLVTVRPGDLALRDAAGTRTYAALADLPDLAGEERVHVHCAGPGDPRAFLELLLTTWAAGGSVVLSKGPADPGVLAERRRVEHTTLDLAQRD